MSGTLSVGLFEVTTDSIGLNQIEDVVITSETHNDLIRFNDNATDPTYTDGFVNKSGIEIRTLMFLQLLLITHYLHTMITL